MPIMNLQFVIKYHISIKYNITHMTIMCLILMASHRNMLKLYCTFSKIDTNSVDITGQCVLLYIILCTTHIMVRDL